MQDSEDQRLCASRKPSPVVATGITLREPTFLKHTAVVMPAWLLVLFGLVHYFRAAVVFGALILPPYACWAAIVWVGAGRQRLGLGARQDRKVLLDTTIAGFALVQVGMLIGSIGALFNALAVLTVWATVIGPSGYTLIILVYLAAFAASMVSPDWVMRIDSDAARALPRTRLGRFLRAVSAVASGPRIVGALAGPVLAITVFLRAVLSKDLMAGLLGALALILGFAALLMVGVGLRRWQYLRRLRKAEFGGTD
jgi:hypothetical protein